MISLLTAFFSSLITCHLIIRFNHLHAHISADHDLLGPQKVHKKSTPRVGGISVIFGLFLALMIIRKHSADDYSGIILLCCSFPTFAIGLSEDITKKIAVRTRLLVTAISSVLAVYLLEMRITSLDIIFLDPLFTISLIGSLFTIFAITGLANAYNIIDGFNGLASMVGIITLFAIAYIGFIFSDLFIVQLSLVMSAAILGFFILNYPRGLIFLGDGGAYLIGFWIATLSILLVNRNPGISPWFALMINAYPILETLFSIYRRKFYKGKNLGNPDGIHFHTLIYRRILMREHRDKDWFSANARTSPYLWILTTLSIGPAILYWYSTPILFGSLTLFVITYVWLYTVIVKFKTPKWFNLYK